MNHSTLQTVGRSRAGGVLFLTTPSSCAWALLVLVLASNCAFAGSGGKGEETRNTTSDETRLPLIVAAESSELLQDTDAAAPPDRNDGSCPLPQILHEVSERATELVENLQSFTATEQIQHTEFRKDGKPRRSTTELFTYVAELHENPYGEFWVHEYREAKTQSDPPPLVENATAASALIFHPKMIGDFEILCKGQTDLQGKPAWELQFEERPNPTKSFSSFLTSGKETPVRLKGRAWISTSNYQLLRLERDLMAPVPEIKLQFEHSDIVYAPVEFKNHRFSLWLPKNASMDIGYRGHHYHRVHSFSHFELFLVDTEERVKDPTQPTPKSGLTSDRNQVP